MSLSLFLGSWVDSWLLIPVLRSLLISKLAADANTFQSTLFIDLRSDICSALTFFQSFTGTNSASSFFKHEKGLVWEMVRFPYERRVEWKASHFIKMPKERHRRWLPSFDTTICCLCLSKKIWFHWLRWIALSNVCEFELKWFQKITTTQRCPIPTSTAGIWDGYGGIHCCRKLLRRRSHGVGGFTGELKFNWKTIDCYDKLVKSAAVCQCICNKCLNCKCTKNNIKCLRFCNCVQKCQNIWFWLHSIWNFRS